MKPVPLVCLLVCIEGARLLDAGTPRVFVVTPGPPPDHGGRAAPAPFYYHTWMRRMDPPRNATTTTPTPDLIFADFESGNNVKSIRKLLENEKIQPKTTTTSRPIYVPDVPQEVVQGLPAPTDLRREQVESTTPDMTDYFALYNNMYNVDSAPVYVASSTAPTTTTTTTAAGSSSTAPAAGSEASVRDIWHVIDSQKHEEYSGKWEEVANEERETTEKPNEDEQDREMDDTFALPGFGTNQGNGAENESRAIRTEQNMRFPYVNLKPFQMKTQKKPLVNTISNSKKGNNMFTNLDSFQDIKHPVRGEAQDVVMGMRQPIDRYNSAQPYLPKYGSKSKSSPSETPMKAVANLVPPPPPPPPRINDGDFPAPTSYDSFPPYPPGPPAPPLPAPAPPSIMFQPPAATDDTDDSADSDGPPDLSYRYKPPSPPAVPFTPTLPPQTKLSGYSYDKPPAAPDSPDDTPDFTGYHYSKPVYSPPKGPPSYGPDTHYGPDYPDLIYDKPHAVKDDMKDTDMGMVPPPPPPPPDMKPDGAADDHGFPPDFYGGDLKLTHDFDDHDFHHYHHHKPTTTTSTTEMPRVNRYSYYYLGKKLYYLPLYFSVYFIVYVGALIIKAVLRHKIVYPNSWRPNDGSVQTSGFFSKRSLDSFDLSNERLHEITGRATHAIAEAGKKYFSQKKRK